MLVETQKFKDKYVIKSTRLENYDYSQNGMYFVTICTKNREEFFGEIEDREMILNDIGKITKQFWQEIPQHFPFTKLDEYQIMPNHVHGIIEILQNVFVETPFMASCAAGSPNIRNAIIQNAPIENHTTAINRDAMNRVSTIGDNKKRGGITGENNPMLHPHSLSKIIRWHKGRCSFEIRKNIFPTNFTWQPRFYDRIIRNEIELNKIREYIQANPIMWERDRNNLENIWM